MHAQAVGAPALYRASGHVAVVTLNRPDALNAVNAALSCAVGGCLQRAEDDPSVRAVVITGTGRAFCAGADLKEVAAGRSIYDPDHPEWDFAGLVRHWVSKPVIAAVNGFALGGGTEIVLACDLAVIDETASLGLPEVRRGLLAAAGGVIRLQRQLPFKIAAEIALTGSPVNAGRAYELGLVNRVAPAGASLEVALELAAMIAENAPVAIRETKRVMHATAAQGSDWEDEVWEVNQAAMATVFRSSDAREGARAFAEKRPPVWSGS
jgi:enoyl-CoA hydratase/carnithine racemase